MKIYTESYGCTMNKAETAQIDEAIKKNGYEQALDPAEADIILIGTCIVIQHTENHMLKRIEELKKYNKKMVISGCLPAIKKDLPAEYAIITPKQLNGTLRLFDMNLDLKGIGGESPVAIPIAQGCLGKCTYCITKLARGHLKSYPEQEIIRKAELSVSLGHKEIRVTAQDTAAYGKDRGTDLPELLKKIIQIPGEYRIRVGMMEPRETATILEPLLEVYESPKIFKFIHLPVQSGDDAVLNDMKREYSVSDFYNIISKFKSKFSHFTFSTDIIVGYPTETDESFEKSVKLIQDIKPDILNITRFSPRPLTVAYDLKPILQRKVKDRSRILTQIHLKISEENNIKLIGTVHKALVTEFGKRYFLARSEGYRPIILKDVKINNFYDVEIVDAGNVYLIGKVI
ncbi:MAG: tRNA (N(6)-L-threonylcarbamoyladenosine(37)-C(2))-methylthiotransferase [Thermoplasmata archaeon]